MAWNEPGNSNNQDPWGGGRKGGGNNGNNGNNGGDRQGPPDLDEAFRKLQESLNGIFGGGKKSSGGGSSNNAGSFGVFGLAVLLIAGAWVYNAVYVLDEQEQAVILRFGKYNDTVGPGGLHMYFPPFEAKFQENVTRERAYSNQGAMLTMDENIVEVPLTVQYRVSNLEHYVLNVDQPEVSLQHATESALRHVVGSTTMDGVLTEGREQMAVEVTQRLQHFLDTYKSGITVSQVNIQNAAAPREVQDAFDDVIRAREDEQREKNQAESYANGVIPEARGQAQRILEDASAYRDELISRATGEAKRFNQLLTEYQRAPEVTRQRLYLETVEEVLANTSKVLVTGKEGQNNLLYLPLDKMVERRGPSAAVEEGTSSSSRSTTSRVQTDFNDRNLRSRESR
ncbi:FtsH protease activity modulator HflK [Atopomonas sediminilitoris]|uniref:FtsH protease activity modulator HflK n=1 Tax=Atopomonas sediminilitoris TaxID=2919919 RepID=UPI001F4EED9B|nr:FtsH protease activity modulator HflK [Atopomonas sediminilitoris]MCJ8170245.1 FtsH protease activity modulator HflK [Atopomonas sediminilitoris]